MSGALVFGLIASSPLVVGALVGCRVKVPRKVLAAMLAFAAGSLITALAFELFEDSYEQGGIWRAAVGLVVGAVVFTGLSHLLDRWAAPDGPDDHGRGAVGGDGAVDGRGSAKLDPDAAATDRPTGRASAHGAAGLALLAAVTLDGVPENLALGVSLTSGTGGLALLAAIFVSNFPEALVGSASMRAQGRSTGFVLGTWSVCAVLLTGAVLLGAGPLASSSAETISLPLAFAAGAVLASLADTLMPEAYEQGGPTVALSTTAGFLLSFVLATL